MASPEKEQRGASSEVTYADARTCTIASERVSEAASKAYNFGHPTLGADKVKEFTEKQLKKLRSEVFSVTGAPLDQFIMIPANNTKEAVYNFILACVIAYKKSVGVYTKKMAHILVGNGTPQWILDYLTQLNSVKIVWDTYIQTDKNAGLITPEVVQQHIKDTTILVIIPAVDPIIGTIHPIENIYNSCVDPSGRKIPLFCELGPLYRIAPPLVNNCLDVFTVDPIHVNSISGVGLFVIRKSLAVGYELTMAELGDLNVSAICALTESHRLTFKNRAATNMNVAKIIRGIETLLEIKDKEGAIKLIRVNPRMYLRHQKINNENYNILFRNELKDPDKSKFKEKTVIILGDTIEKRLPNLLPLAIRGPKNTKADALKTALELRKIIVGSYRGNLRDFNLPVRFWGDYILFISLSDYASKEDGMRIGSALLDVIDKCV